MKKLELLAPAGDIKAFYAAIEGGADAIYLGGKMFGARAFSQNFSKEEIIEAIKYAHLYGVKVYVTCNTLVHEHEVNDFIDYVEFLHKNNVDAILVQDLGMFDYLRKTYPNLEIHSSTQMHIHNFSGVKLMQELGIKRVVLARETTIDDIKKIKKETDMDIEVFVHGALCVSYSGQCLMSYFNGKRSANRGECAGCCRLKYDVIDSNGNVLNKDDKYPISMKDLNSLERIGQLIDADVDSLKIEGRMKSPAYVYLVTSLYRQAIDSYYKDKKVVIDKKKLHDLKVVFNREYTKGFLFNEDNNNIINMKSSNHQGVEVGTVIKAKNNHVEVKLSDEVFIGDALRILSSKEDAIILNNFYIKNKLVKEAHKGDIISFDTHEKIDYNASILKTASAKINEEINTIINSKLRRVPITVNITAKVNEPLKIVATDGKNSVREESIILESSINRPTSKEELEEKINRLNDSAYVINSLKINIDNNVFVPLKIFNDLRRTVIEKLNEKRQYKIDYIKEEYDIKLPNLKKEKNENILKDNLFNDNIIRLPKIIRSYDEYDKNKKYLVSEVGALYEFKNIDTDYSLNVTNSYTVAFLHSLGVNKITLSLELDYDSVRNIIASYEKRYNKHPNLEVVVSSNIEVMSTKFDLNKYYNLDNLSLKGSKHKYILKSNDNYMSIYLSDRKEDNNNYFILGINNIRRDYI